MGAGPVGSFCQPGRAMALGFAAQFGGDGAPMCRPTFVEAQASTTDATHTGHVSLLFCSVRVMLTPGECTTPAQDAHVPANLHEAMRHPCTNMDISLFCARLAHCVTTSAPMHPMQLALVHLPVHLLVLSNKPN